MDTDDSEEDTSSSVDSSAKQAITESRLLRWGIILANGTLTLLLLIAIYQSEGFLTMIGVYISISAIFGIIKYFFISTKELTKQIEDKSPRITKEQLSDSKSKLSVSNTEGSVVVALAGEKNIADFQNTYRELKDGQSLTLTESDDEITLTAHNQTETIPKEKTEVNFFQYDYVLLACYDNLSTTDTNITYGDI